MKLVPKQKNNRSRSIFFLLPIALVPFIIINRINRNNHLSSFPCQNDLNSVLTEEEKREIEGLSRSYYDSFQKKIEKGKDLLGCDELLANNLLNYFYESNLVRKIATEDILEVTDTYSIGQKSKKLDRIVFLTSDLLLDRIESKKEEDLQLKKIRKLLSYFCYCFITKIQPEIVNQLIAFKNDLVRSSRNGYHKKFNARTYKKREGYFNYYFLDNGQFDNWRKRLSIAYCWNTFSGNNISFNSIFHIMLLGGLFHLFSKEHLNKDGDYLEKTLLEKILELDEIKEKKVKAELYILGGREDDMMTRSYPVKKNFSHKDYETEYFLQAGSDEIKKKVHDIKTFLEYTELEYSSQLQQEDRRVLQFFKDDDISLKNIF